MRGARVRSWSQVRGCEPCVVCRALGQAQQRPPERTVSGEHRHGVGLAPAAFGANGRGQPLAIRNAPLVDLLESRHQRRPPKPHHPLTRRQAPPARHAEECRDFIGTAFGAAPPIVSESTRQVVRDREPHAVHRQHADDVVALASKREEHVIAHEPLQRGGRRAIPGPGRQPRELAAHQRSNPRFARTESQLVVEPPGAGLQALVVFVTQLIGIDRKGVGSEHRPHGRNQASVDPGRFASAECLEDVEGQLGRTEQRTGECVANRDAVTKREKRIDGLEQKAALRDDAQTRELQAVVPIDDAHVAGSALAKASRSRSRVTIDSWARWINRLASRVETARTRGRRMASRAEVRSARAKRSWLERAAPSRPACGVREGPSAPAATRIGRSSSSNSRSRTRGAASSPPSVVAMNAASVPRPARRRAIASDRQSGAHRSQALRRLAPSGAGGRPAARCRQADPTQSS